MLALGWYVSSCLQEVAWSWPTCAAAMTSSLERVHLALPHIMPAAAKRQASGISQPSVTSKTIYLVFYLLEERQSNVSTDQSAVMDRFLLKGNAAVAAAEQRQSSRPFKRQRTLADCKKVAILVGHTTHCFSDENVNQVSQALCMSSLPCSVQTLTGMPCAAQGGPG